MKRILGGIFKEKMMIGIEEITADGTEKKETKMKNANYTLLSLTVLIQSCTGQTTTKKEIYNKDFNWTITIPENFESVSAEQ